MAQSTFDRALKLALAHEGGFSNHRDDPGGATNFGVTQATFDAWLKRQGKPARSVRTITDTEVAAIYKRQYWDAISGDDLPSGLDYAVFDYAVNSGPGRAVKDLQRVLGVKVDGALGVNTLNAIRGKSVARLIADLCDTRMRFLKSLKHWSTFGKGWTRRVNDVRSAATAMAGNGHVQAPVVKAGSEKADPRDVAVTSTSEGKAGAVAGVGVAGATITEAAEKIGAVSEASEIIKYVFIALTVIGVALTVWALVHRLKEQAS